MREEKNRNKILKAGKQITRQDQKNRTLSCQQRMLMTTPIYSMCMFRHLRYMTAFAVHFPLENKMKHHHLAYKCKNAYGALFYLPWLGTECRHATIMFFISTVRTILMRTSFWRTNYFYLSCVTLSNSPILAQPKQINCFSSS